MEHPQPPVGLADANAGLVAGQRRPESSRALIALVSREGRAAVVEDGDERAFADFKPEQVVQHDDEARQAIPWTERR